MSADTEYVSIREFARRDGCNDALVRRAIKDGKLRVSADGKVDASQAGKGWRKANRRSAGSADTGADKPKKSARRPGADTAATERVGGDDFLADLTDEDFVAEILAGRFRGTITAERVKENALAAKHLLAARRDAGDVVDLEIAEAVLFEQAREYRDALMNWPMRVGPLIAAELGIDADPVVEALKNYVQQLLDDLGEPDADWAGRED
jgi:hypothetical protein